MSGRQSKARRRRALAALPAARARLRAAEPHALLLPPLHEKRLLEDEPR